MRKGGLFVLAAVILVALAGLSYASFVSNLKFGELKVTTEHPFLVTRSQQALNSSMHAIWIPASQLQVGDELTTPDGKKARVTSVEDVVDSSGFDVYNFETKENDYVAGDIVVHNSNTGLIRTIGDIKIREPPKSEYSELADVVVKLEGRDYLNGIRTEEARGFAVAAWANRLAYLGLNPSKKIVRAVVFQGCSDNSYTAIAARAETSLSREVVSNSALGVSKANEMVGIGKSSDGALGGRMVFEFYKQQLSLFINTDGTVDTAIVFEVRNRDANLYKRVLGAFVEDITAKLGHAPTETFSGSVSATKTETATIEINNLLIRPENIKPAIEILSRRAPR